MYTGWPPPPKKKNGQPMWTKFDQITDIMR